MRHWSKVSLPGASVKHHPSFGAWCKTVRGNLREQLILGSNQTNNAMKDGKYIALVTGATGGLGTDMCKKLADDGYFVIANYRTDNKAEEWSAKMKAEG